MACAQVRLASPSTASSSGSNAMSGRAYSRWSMRYPTSSSQTPPMSSVTSGMPSSRSSSLSRSNIRSKASSLAASPYCGTMSRILRLGQRPARVEQAEHEVEQALGLGRAGRVGGSPARRYPSARYPPGLRCCRDAVARGDGLEQVRPVAGRRGVCRCRWRATPPTPPVRALAYTALVGEPRPGDRVLLNASALLRGLGTGGLAFVVARTRPPAGRPAGRPGPHRQGAVHARCSRCSSAVDEQDSPHHALTAGRGRRRPRPDAGRRRRPALRPARGPGRHPCGRTPGARVVYVMTDGGALPLAFSRAVAGLARAGLAARHGHRGPGLRRRPRGRHACTPVCWRPATSSAPTSPSWSRAGQRRHRHAAGATPGWPRRGAQRRRRAAAAAGSRRCASRTPTRASGTAGSRHHSRTAYGRALPDPRRRAAWRRCPTPSSDALVARAGGRPGQRRAGELTVRRGAGRRRSTALRDTPVALTTMGRGSTRTTRRSSRAAAGR